MARFPKSKSKVCGDCVWLKSKWGESACVDEGKTESSEACERYETERSPSRYWGLPALRKAARTLKSSSYKVPKVRAELEDYLLQASTAYYPTKTSARGTNKKLSVTLSRLQSYRDRVVVILDDVNQRLTRVKHLRNDVRIALEGLDDVQALRTAAERGNMIDGIMRPVLKRYDALKNLKEYTSSVLFNLKDALDTTRTISQLHSLNIRSSE